MARKYYSPLGSSTKLQDLRTRAKTIGIRIETDEYDVAVNGSKWGYWLVDEATGVGPWVDDNHCATRNEVKDKLRELEFERGVRFKAMASA
jgi:hypothetical protein